LKSCSPAHLGFLLLATLFFGTARAAAPPSYPGLLLDDIQEVVTAPARWESDDWKNAGWAGLAIIGTALVIDAPLRDEMRRQPPGNQFLLNIERFGAEYSIGVLGGFYLAGSLADNDKALMVAQDGLAASIIASGLIAPAIKIGTGRSRPYENDGTHNFQFLGAGKLNSSFPSGHTTEAFTLASVIAAHYEETWIKSSAYTVAALVGVARIYHDAHFASDVLAGAIIGNWVGQSVVAHNRTKRNKNVILLPDAAQDYFGLRLAGRF
jgi:membrane-associated phospholipid phosphatase